MLEQYWTLEKLSATYPVLFLSTVAVTTIEFAKSQLEWMSDQILNKFHNNRENQFNLKHIQLCHSLAQVRKPNKKTKKKPAAFCVGSNFHRFCVQIENVKKPRVILCSTPTLENGFSLDLFLKNGVGQEKFDYSYRSKRTQLLSAKDL